MRAKSISAWTIGIPLMVMGLVVLVVGVALPLGTKPEPLADPHVLSQLIAGTPILPPVPAANPAEFHGETMIAPLIDTEKQLRNVLSAYTGEKRIEVDLTNQKVYAYEGNKRVMSFLVSTGLWGRTPTGTFAIWTKVRSQTMQGGNKAWGTYYYLPNVEYVMFFSNNEVEKMRGFSFHGTYWHENFGHPMSHGCINMRTAEAKMLYDWASPTVTNDKAWSTLASLEDPGTTVEIYGVAPTE